MQSCDHPDQYCSFDPSDMAGKIKLYNAINSPDERLGNVVNVPLNIRDVVICKVALSKRYNTEDNDGNKRNKSRISEKRQDNTDDNPFEDSGNSVGFRVIVIDDEGKSYTATSQGVYNSICIMRNVFGTLHFEPQPLKVMVKSIDTKNGKTLTLSIID